MKKAEADRPRRGRRVSGWLSGKVRHSYEGGRRRENIGSAAGAVKESLRLATWDPSDFRSGYEGRYDDGGRDRFNQEVEKQGLSEGEIDALRIHHRVICAIFVVATMIGIVMSFVFMTSGMGGISILSSLAMIPVCFLFLVMAVRHDYSAWQISERRFGGFRSYLNSRCG